MMGHKKLSWTRQHRGAPPARPGRRPRWGPGCLARSGEGVGLEGVGGSPNAWVPSPAGRGRHARTPGSTGAKLHRPCVLRHRLKPLRHIPPQCP